MCFPDLRAKAGCTAHHLLKENTAVDFAHENQIADGRHVNACSEQINGHRDIGILVILIFFDDLQDFLFVAARSLAGNLHNSVIGNTVGFINLAKHIHDLIGVGVTDGKYQRLFSAFRVQVSGNFRQHLFWYGQAG